MMLPSGEGAPAFGLRGCHFVQGVKEDETNWFSFVLLHPLRA